MQKIEFKEKYKVGVELIDREHEELFVCLNKVSIACESGDKASLVALLDSFVDLAHVHFSHEEEYMKAIDHPNKGLYMEEHFICESQLIEQIGLFHDNQDASLLIYEIESLLLSTISFDRQILSLPTSI